MLHALTDHPTAFSNNIQKWDGERSNITNDGIFYASETTKTEAGPVELTEEEKYLPPQELSSIMVGWDAYLSSLGESHAG